MKKFLFFALLAAVFLINPHVSSAETLSYIPDNPEKALIIIHGYGQNGARMQGMTNSLRIYPIPRFTIRPLRTGRRIAGTSGLPFLRLVRKCRR